MRRVRALIVLLTAAAISTIGSTSASARCIPPPEADVAAALARIEASIDPCGASAELVRVVDAFRRCGRDQCRVCIDRTRERNTTERGDAGIPITITWNPDLRTELEPGCDGAASAVQRDPIASLAHELVHAGQALAGADFTESDAVRVENVYRRASGLCQRTRYGDEPLPATMLIDCSPHRCSCGADSPTAVWASGAPNAQATGVMAGDLGAKQP